MWTRPRVMQRNNIIRILGLCVYKCWKPFNMLTTQAQYSQKGRFFSTSFRNLIFFERVPKSGWARGVCVSYDPESTGGRTSWVPVQSQEVLSKDVKMWGQVLSLVDGELYEIWWTKCKIETFFWLKKCYFLKLFLSKLLWTFSILIK